MRLFVLDVVVSTTAGVFGVWLGHVLAGGAPDVFLLVVVAAVAPFAVLLRCGVWGAWRRRRTQPADRVADS